MTLHVGLDTFRPVTEDDPEAHPMHAEWYTASAETAVAILETKRAGGRVIAGGTTSVRVLESVAGQPGGWRSDGEPPGRASYRCRAIAPCCASSRPNRLFPLPGSRVAIGVPPGVVSSSSIDPPRGRAAQLLRESPADSRRNG